MSNQLVSQLYNLHIPLPFLYSGQHCGKQLVWCRPEQNGLFNSNSPLFVIALP